MGMKTYPNHSVVRVHTSTLEKIKWLSNDMKIRPPKLIDLVVDYFMEREKNYPYTKEREDK